MPDAHQRLHHRIVAGVEVRSVIIDDRGFHMIGCGLHGDEHAFQWNSTAPIHAKKRSDGLSALSSKEPADVRLAAVLAMNHPQYGGDGTSFIFCLFDIAVCDLSGLGAVNGR